MLLQRQYSFKPLVLLEVIIMCALCYLYVICRQILMWILSRSTYLKIQDRWVNKSVDRSADEYIGENTAVFCVFVTCL